MKKIKVLMVTSSYPIKGSNLGAFIQNIVKDLTSLGVEVGVMVFSTSKQYHEYKQNGATIYEYPYVSILPPLLHKNKGIIPSVRSNWLAKFELISYYFKTRKYIKKLSKNYDIVHAHWFIPSGFIACNLKHTIKKPLITTAWGAEFHLPNNPLVRKILGYTNKQNDKIIAVSNYMVKKAEEYGLNTQYMEVIPNSINLKQFTVKRHRHKSDKIIIGTIRRLVPEKRINDLIDSVSLLPENIKQKIELWIVGDGPEKNNLIKLVELKHITNITKFFGMIDHSKVPNILSKIDIYVNPSIQEGMATANIEAMRAGCAVIATRGYGNDEVIDNNKNGILFNGKNINELSKKLKLLINDTQLLKKFGTNAKTKIKDNFSSLRIAKLYLKQYGLLLEK